MEARLCHHSPTTLTNSASRSNRSAMPSASRRFQAAIKATGMSSGSCSTGLFSFMARISWGGSWTNRVQWLSHLSGYIDRQPGFGGQVQPELSPENGEQLGMILKLATVLLAAGLAAGQAAVEQGDALPARSGQGHIQAAIKAGIRVGAGVPVGHLAVDERHGSGAAFIDILPATATPDLMVPKAVFLLQATRFMGGVLNDIGPPFQRGGQGGRADPNIDQPAGAVTMDFNKHVGARHRLLAVVGAQAHARAQRPGVETQPAQRLEHQTVVLKTVAAAAAGDQLVENGLRLDFYRPAQQDVDIFKRDGLNMRRRKVVQGLRLNGRAATVVNAFELGVQGQRAGHRFNGYNELSGKHLALLSHFSFTPMRFFPARCRA